MAIFSMPIFGAGELHL